MLGDRLGCLGGSGCLRTGGGGGGSEGRVMVVSCIAFCEKSLSVVFLGMGGGGAGIDDRGTAVRVEGRIGGGGGAVLREGGGGGGGRRPIVRKYKSYLQQKRFLSFSYHQQRLSFEEEEVEAVSFGLTNGEEEVVVVAVVD